MSEVVTCKSGLTEKEKSTVFWASFLALLACGVGFTFRVLTMGNWIDEFGISGQEAGGIFGYSLWPIAVTMILFSLIVDKVGYKPSMYIAFILQAVSVVMCATAGDPQALKWGCFMAGLGHGIVEAVINPACSSMYTDDKSTKLNILHAAWPAGIVVGAVCILPLGVAQSAAGMGVAEGAAGIAWRTHSWWMLAPVAIYGVMFLKAKFPVDERVRANVPYSVMLKDVGFLGAFIAGTLLFYELFKVFTGNEPANLIWISLAVGAGIGALFGGVTKSIGKPMFFFLCLLMIPLATTELGTDAWIKQLMTPSMGEYAGWAIALSAFIMMVLRFQAGALLHRFNPPIVLCISSFFSMIGLMTLSTSAGIMVFVAFVLYAVGQTFYWPTVLGLVSERYPKGGAMTLNTVSAIGLLSVGIIGTPIMGVYYDSSKKSEVTEMSAEAYEVSKTSADFFGVAYGTVDEAYAKQYYLFSQLKAAGLEKLDAAKGTDAEKAIAKDILFYNAQGQAIVTAKDDGFLAKLSESKLSDEKKKAAFEKALRNAKTGALSGLSKKVEILSTAVSGAGDQVKGLKKDLETLVNGGNKDAEAALKSMEGLDDKVIAMALATRESSSLATLLAGGKEIALAAQITKAQTKKSVEKKAEAKKEKTDAEKLAELAGGIAGASVKAAQSSVTAVSISGGVAAVEKVFEVVSATNKEFKGVIDNAGRGALMTTALTFPLIMLICFALIAFYFKSIGGYKPVVLEGEGAESNDGNSDNKHDDPEGEPIPAVEL